MRRVRGLIDLVFHLVDETSHLVERTNGEVVERWARRLTPIRALERSVGVVADVQTSIAGGVCRSVRLINGVTRWSVNAVADVAEAGADRTAGADDVEPARLRYLDRLQASLNGFWGDYLGRANPRLDLGLTLRHLGRPLPAKPDPLAGAYPCPTSKICVFVHGLASTESSWSLFSKAHYGDPDVTFGTRLRDELGFTPMYVRYNSGRPISENGRALAVLLTEVMQAFPVPLEEIALVGHSMGGLVARSAAYSAHRSEEPWLSHLRHVACIGTPHGGAPLEKAARWLAGTLEGVDAAGARVPAAILATRSAGIQDLGYSHTADDEWFGDDPDEVSGDARRRVAHVDGVGYHFLAATIAGGPGHPIGRHVGDWLVPLSSASGRGPGSGSRSAFASGTVFPDMNHFDIVNHPEVYCVLRDLLAT